MEGTPEIMLLQTLMWRSLGAIMTSLHFQSLPEYGQSILDVGVYGMHAGHLGTYALI